MKYIKYLIIGLLQMYVSVAVGQENTVLSPDSLYNLGNAAFSQEKFDEAIFYYEKAKLLDPRSKDIRINLQLANEKLSTEIIELEPFFLASWWKNFINVFLPGGWKVLSILLLICIIGLFYLYLFKHMLNRKRIFYPIFGFVLVLFIITILAGKSRYNDIFNSPFAIIFGEDQFLLLGPDVVSEEVKQITGGNKLRILDEDMEWYKVSAMDNEQGWIKKENIKLIKF